MSPQVLNRNQMHLLLVAILPLGDVMPIKIGLCIQSGIRLGWCANREDICLQGHWVPQLPAAICATTPVRVQRRSTPSSISKSLVLIEVRCNKPRVGWVGTKKLRLACLNGVIDPLSAKHHDKSLPNFFFVNTLFWGKVSLFSAAIQADVGGRLVPWPEASVAR